MNGSMCLWKVRLFSSCTEISRIVVSDYIFIFAAVALPRPDEMILFTMESVEDNPNELFYASLDAQVSSSCTDTSRIVKNRTLPKKKQWQFRRSGNSGIPSGDAIHGRIFWTTSFCLHAKFQALFVVQRRAPI
jgi:hypothetical protein